MDSPIGFRWLGVAGVELAAGGQTLAIDPYFTRIPMRRLWLGRVRPDARLVAEKLPRCDTVLVSHPHFDHLMDVPDVVRNTGALALGSDHTCRLLEAEGIPPVRIRRITAGERLSLGEFQVEVLPAEHLTLAGRPMLAGPLADDLQPPFRALDYRMDCCFSYLIEVQGRRLLFWASQQPGPAPAADVLFTGLYGEAATYARLLGDVQPQTVVPVHWDDFFRPLAKPVRTGLMPPEWRLPPLRRLDLGKERRTIAEAAPGVAVFVPEMFREYEIV